MRQRMVSMMVLGAVLTGTLSELSGTKVSARPRHRPTVMVSRRPAVGRWIGPRHGRTVYTSPWRRRFIRLGTPCPGNIVVHGPVTKHVVVSPLPTISVSTPRVVVEPTVITVWVTNSNGSRITVKLTRDGSWYVGPRGEWYTSLPTNEQLRVAYGF